MLAGRLSRLLLSSFMVGAALVTAAGSAASAPSAALTAEQRGGGSYKFRFTFDNDESLRKGTRVKDVTGHGNYGVVKVTGGGHLTREPGIAGRGAGYPGRCPKCGRALIEISDSKGLDPRRRPFRFGTAVKVTDRQAKAGKDPNLVQKGLLSQPGGQWKLELIGARPRCVIVGSRGGVNIIASAPIDDAKWHQLECRRKGQTVTLWIDGVLRGTTVGKIGRIVNNAPVRIGGKAVGSASDNDQYHGDLDSVFLRVRTR